MRLLKKSLTVAAAVLTLSTAPVLAEQNEVRDKHKFEKAQSYYTECSYATQEEFDEIMPSLWAFTDMELMAETINDPEKFFELMDVVNDPHTIHVMANCSTEPVMWTTWMKNVTDLNKWTMATAKVMNPVGMMKWMVAPINPEIWKSSFAHLNPEKYTKWGTALINPTFYSPITSLADWEWYEPRIEWLVSLDSYMPMVEMFYPFIEPFYGDEKAADDAAAEGDPADES